MKYIRQISTGRAVHREEPHRVDEKVLGNASFKTGIPLNDLELVDEALTNEQWTAKILDEIPWEQKMLESDAILPRWAEDMLDAMNASDFANVDQVTKDKLTAKKNMRSQKPA